jgi:SAM-dependent methyltransferase
VDIRDYNRRAWDAQVSSRNVWTVPVSADDVRRARAGDWQVVLTPVKPVPRAWFGDLAGAEVLGLASAGGQQCPLLAAAGARVTVYDNSPAQLGQDRAVADREGLAMAFLEGDMRDLSALADASFDLVFHPVSNCFVPEVRPVWREAFRVLRPGGALLAGACNPIMYIFDHAASERGELIVRHALPYSDLTSLTAEEREAFVSKNEPLSFGHTLEDQLGGQTDAGFHIAGFYEDSWRNVDHDPLSKYSPSFIATRSIKPE